jgi:hypothetical protein
MRLGWLGFWTLVALMAIVIAWPFGLVEAAKFGMNPSTALDWITGIACLVWLLFILKAPWDIYFEAHRVSFEIQRSKERNIPILPGREEYVRKVKTRLGWIAVAAHVISATVIAAITYFSGGKIGYYFAGFYLLSTSFRPVLAAYLYLIDRLRTIDEESRYPREDMFEVRESLRRHEETLRMMAQRIDNDEETFRHESETREEETRQLRQSVHSIGRELEVTITRLTDNQDVIRGIQAFVRLIGQSGARSNGAEA